MQDTYKSDIKTIMSLREDTPGHVVIDNRNVAAQLVLSKETYLLKVDQIIDLGIDDQTFTFTGIHSNIVISAVVNGHKNSATIGNKLISRYSEAKVYSFWNENIDDSYTFHRC